jgi:hypothetical protein
VGGRDEGLSSSSPFDEPPVTAMKQSQQEAQEQYRRNQAAAQAQLDAAKQPMNADAVALLTSRDIDQMSGEVYKVHITSNPAFVTRVNELATTEKRKPR